MTDTNGLKDHETHGLPAVGIQPANAFSGTCAARLRLVGSREVGNIVQCEAPKIAKLVYNSNVAMVYGTYNYSYRGESKPT